jgi:AcrR family transcriptional regulator
VARTGAPAGGTGIDPEALWSEAERSRLGRPPAHNRAKITAAAIAIADAEGIGAVTMRRIASTVGAGTMSLYTYVPDKETLVELMIDQVGGEHGLPAAPTGDWRVDLCRLAHAQRTVMRRHRWLPAVLAARQTLGPNTLATMEYALAALAHTGLDGPAKLETIALLTGFVANYVAHELAQESTNQRTGRGAQHLLAAQTRYLRTVAESGRYPRLAQILAAPDSEADPHTDFDRLLNRLVTNLVPGLSQAVDRHEET